MLDSGANPDLTNNLGQTPLHLAATNENAFSIRTLVKYNANVNCFDINGNTPLHEIIKVGNLLRHQWLKFEQNNIIQAHNKNSKSNNSNLVSIAQFLVSNGADLNAKNMVCELYRTVRMGTAPSTDPSLPSRLSISF